ncbi:predicted protein [Postia placenta Mad-698-R]|nr:predicted protein [Postia placenta Mad-698-R]
MATSDIALTDVQVDNSSPQHTHVEFETLDAVPLASSSRGRVSGKPWKPQKTATVRSLIPDGVKTKSWEDRMQKIQKQKAIKQLQTELSEEKKAEKTRRREITLERKKAAEERRRLEEDKAKARTADFNHSHPFDLYPIRWAHERLHASAAGLAGPRRSTTETLWYCGTGGIHVSVAFISFGMAIPIISPRIVTISGCVWNPSGLETHIHQLEHATCPSGHRFKKLYKLACWSIIHDHDLALYLSMSQPCCACI